MRRVLTSTVALATLTTAAHAGGIERSTTPLSILFEDGNYAEVSFGNVDPSVSGAAPAVLGGTLSGDMAASFGSASLAYKTALTDDIDLAVIIDQPYGVDVDYPAGTFYPFAGSNATVRSTGVTAALRYDLGNQFSVLGGLRSVTTQGEATVVPVGGYTLSTTTETDFGYLLGVAYEKPEIALRVGLTYASEITHDFDATEFGALSTTFASTLPQSLTLDAQSGIAADTLLFGSIRWVDWSEFDISPTAFAGASGSSLVDYDEDVITYSIGVGRKFSDTWSGAISISHEAPGEGTVGNLGPTNGNTSISLGGTYTKDNMKITGGVRYVWIGDAETVLAAGAPNSTFEDNSAIGIGFKVGFSF